MSLLIVVDFSKTVRNAGMAKSDKTVRNAGMAKSDKTVRNDCLRAGCLSDIGVLERVFV